jgi:hypothetical protein
MSSFSRRLARQTEAGGDFSEEAPWCAPGASDHGCVAVIARRLAAVRLAAPVGDRVILDAASGQPVTQEP